MDYKRVAAYVRVSTEEQKNHGLSVEAQQHAIEEWASANKHRIVGWYNDAGLSARKPASKRPELQRLLSDVRQGDIDVIVFTKLDRWFRNVQEYYKVQEVLDEYKVPWEAIQEDYETETASGRFKVNIMLAVAQDEADRDSERIKAVMERKRQKGELLNGVAPLGYKYLRDEKKIVYDPETKEAVQIFFDNLVRSKSCAIAVNEAKRRTGISIPRATAYRMRTLGLYYGDFHGVAVPAYITKEQQSEIAEGIKAMPRGTGIEKLFSGLCWCKDCERRFVASSTSPKYKTSRYVFYRCGARGNGYECENSACISETTLENYLLDNFDRILSEYTVSASMKSVSDECNYSAELEKIKRKLSRLKELYVSEIIDIDEYKKDYTALIADKNAMEDKLKEHEQIPRKSKAISLSSDWRNVYNQLERSGKAEFWHGVISRITISRDKTIEVSVK